MSFIFADPFASYSSVADMAKGGWTGTTGTGTTWNTTGGRFGLGARRFTIGSPTSSKSFPACSGNVIVSFDMFLEADTDGSEFLNFYNNSGAAMCLVIANTSADAIEIYNAAGTLVHTSAAAVLSRGVWHRVEIEAQIGSASGIVKVWVDGVLQVNISAVDLTDGSAAGCDRIEWHQTIAPTVPFLFGAPIISDTSGGAPWNAALGDKRMYCLLPTSDASVAWTPSAGANFAAVDDAIPGVSDGDTIYVEHAAASDAVDRYGFANLPAGIVGIVGVIVDLEARKTDAGALPGGDALKAKIEHSGSDTNGAAVTLTTSYECHRTMFLDVPGGSGWTKAQVDAATAGPFFDVP
jgi:hypothetical protein